MSNATEFGDELASQLDKLNREVKSCLEQAPRQRDPDPSNQDVRSASRYRVAYPLIVIPLGVNGRPDQTHRVNGMVRDVSVGGIGALLPADSDSGLSNGLLIGVRQENGEFRYAGAELRHFECKDERDVSIGAEIGGQIHEILQLGTIVPIFRPDRMKFAFDRDTRLLESLEQLGVLQETVIDRIQLCPKCQGFPTFRPGCRMCGSARNAVERLIHHFACAHVSPVADFETSQGLICPKCRTRHIVAGTDFEYLTGQYHCLDCHANDTELGQIGHCLRCGFRFPGHEATVQDVKGFHAHRLDPLDLLAAL